MPLLGAIFGKKNKSTARSTHSANGPASDIDSPLSSPTNSYVTTDRFLPSSPNGKNCLSPEAARIQPSKVSSIATRNVPASSNKFRLPFNRKKHKSPEADASSTFSISPNPSFVPTPRPPYAARLSTSSDKEAPDTRRLGPPPSKSAIFAAYADPNSAFSTHSLPLPDEPMHSWSSMHTPSAPSSPSTLATRKEKRPYLFQWSKSASGTTKTPPHEQSKSPISMNLDSPPRLDSESSSFNLKAFRHVRGPSPTASTSSLVVPPRPRGASVTSDSSQRIAVAAFREAQARRSTAGSPVPSFRSPSPSMPPGFPQDGQRGRASPRPPIANQSHSSPHLRNGAYHQKRLSTNIAVGYTSESDESTTTSEDEESDDEGADGGRNGRIQRDGTITPRTRPSVGKRQAKSEIGHGSPSYDSPSTPSSLPPSSFLTTTRSFQGHGQPDEVSARQSNYVANAQPSAVESRLRSNSSTDRYGDAARPRASASTSALSPSAAAKRASIIASANTGMNQDPLVEVKQATRHTRDSSTYSNPALSQPKFDNDTSDSDSDTDSDNAPLASLVPPRRPGSALSQGSNASQRTNGTRGPGGRAMSKPLIDINQLTKQKPSVGPYKGNDEGFTRGGLLAGHLSSSGGPDVLVESPTSVGFPVSPLSVSSGSTGVTSKTPPAFTQFAAPTPPPKEVQAYASFDLRPSTAPTRPRPQPAQKSDAEKEKGRERSPEGSRDGLTERLTQLAKGKSMDTGMGLDLSGSKRSTSPLPSQPHPQQRAPSARPESPSKQSTTKLSIPPSGASSKPSPPVDDLLQDVDGGILALISRMGDSDDVRLSIPSPPAVASGRDKEMEDDTTTSESESDAYGEPDEEEKESVSDQGKPQVESSFSRFETAEMPSPEPKGRIAPIPIKHRTPAPSFSVMSRPLIQKPVEDDVRSTFTTASASTAVNTRFNARSSTVADDPTLTSNFKSNSTLNSLASSTPSTSNSATATRQRSSTLSPSSATTTNTVASSSSSSTFGASTSSFSKLNVSSKGGSSVASSNPSSVGASSPRLSTANADRASALRTVASSGTSGVGARAAGSNSGQNARQRSSTMVPMTSSSSSSLNKNSSRAPISSAPPVKPFAMRRDSPASSTGDSSSGRAPITPRDGSDIGSSRNAPSSSGKKERKGNEWSSGVSGLGVATGRSGGLSGGAGRHVKGRSVSFEDDVGKENGREGKLDEDEDDAEARRRERRRGEAKAAIELGNVINGPGPIVSDDEDDLPINQAMNPRMSTVNPMMVMNNLPMPMSMSFSSRPGSPGWASNLPQWQQQGLPQMLAPTQFMVPPPAHPNYMVAHQQAMMFAKQAYQMTIAQQAMAAAADEWDRNSAMGGSVYGGPSSNASVMMGGGHSPYNMMNMGGMPPDGWSTGSVIFPNASQSVYGGRGGISSSRSEYGGASVGGNWSSARSTYGESFGPSERMRAGAGGTRNSGMVRDSGYYPPVPPIPQSHSGGSSSSGAAAKGRGRTTSGPATPTRSGIRRAPPPSSWKAGV